MSKLIALLSGILTLVASGSVYGQRPASSPSGSAFFNRQRIDFNKYDPTPFEKSGKKAV